MPTASWNQLERAIEQVHAAARTNLGVREFYRQFVAEAVIALDAAGGAAWRPGSGDRAELICQSLPDDGVEADWSARTELASRTLAGAPAAIVDDRAAHAWLVCPIGQPTSASAGRGAPPAAVLELWLPHGAGPAVQQGWLDFATALADVATDFHAREELRRLRDASALRSQALELTRRVATPRTLAGTAFEIANEGRRLLGCDRVSVVVRRRGAWRVMAVSGVDATPRGELARGAEQLAAQTARWGEPIDYAASGARAPAVAEDLPNMLAAALQEHIDRSHAREVACAPFGRAMESASRTTHVDAVLLAERFTASGGCLRAPLVELADLCAPALARAIELDQFPLRIALRWSDRLAELRDRARLTRTSTIAAAVVAALAALVFVPVDFHIEAPARLAAAVERDVFATASGSVAEVRVRHGQQVAAGDVLIVLSDPELALQLQESRGEFDATRKRLDALAVSRTDRTLRDDPTGERLPLAAEQRELEERLVSLRRQTDLLEARREALTLRSPRAGQVLTRDVQSLLESRPVERGQSLLTIADATQGWELRADVPQRDVGHVLAAMNGRQRRPPVEVSYRLAGDVGTENRAHVLEVSAAAPLDAEGLRDDPAPVEVRIAIDGAAPRAARPGMTANVRIHCGSRSLGYVWLHDIGSTLYRWATF